MKAVIDVSFLYNPYLEHSDSRIQDTIAKQLNRNVFFVSSRPKFIGKRIKSNFSFHSEKVILSIESSCEEAVFKDFMEELQIKNKESVEYGYNYYNVKCNNWQPME